MISVGKTTAKKPASQQPYYPKAMQKQREISRQYAQDREELLQRIWTRLCEVATVDLAYQLRYRAAKNANTRKHLLRMLLSVQPSGWYWESPLEQSMLDMDRQVELDEPEATDSLPGTAERVAVYSQRVWNGEAIWCDGDAVWCPEGVDDE